MVMREIEEKELQLFEKNRRKNRTGVGKRQIYQKKKGKED
jgi:hypothetical protein